MTDSDSSRQKEGITSTLVQAVTITAPVNTITSSTPSAVSQGSSSSSALSKGAKTGIGAGVGAGGGIALLALLGLLLWRRRKSRVGDDFKWPELGDGTGSGATAAGLYPNPTHPTGNNRFDMDDDELFDGQTSPGASNGNGMMSERDPSFLSSANGSNIGKGAYSAGNNGSAYGGLAGLGAGAAGLGAAAAASSQGHTRYGTQSDDHYSQDGHGAANGYSPERSPPGSNYTHNGGGGGGGGGQQGAYQNYQYDPSAQQHQYYNPGGPGLPLPGGAGAAGIGAAGIGAGAAGDRLSRAGSIASTTAGGYQVGAIPEYDQEQGNRPRQGRNRLSVVNALGDVGEE